MAANRYLHQFQGAFYKGMVHLHAEFTVGASGAPTLTAAQSRGVASVARNSAGKYTLTLDDSYATLFDFSAFVIGSTQESLTCQVLSDLISTSKTIAFEFANASSGVAEAGVLETPATASVTDEEFGILTDPEGLKWGYAFDKTGSSAAPSDALWTAIPADRKAQIDISGDVTAAEVMDALKVGMNALAGFAAKFNINDDANDGTAIVTWGNSGRIATPFASYLDDGSQTTGNVTYTQSTAGTESGAKELESGDTVKVNLFLRNSGA